MQIEITYDDGVTGGSGNPGWMYRDDQGDWRPISDPFGPLAPIGESYGPGQGAAIASRARRELAIEIVEAR